MTPAEERERLLLEHLPTVRFLAHCIHSRLPQHVELDDLMSAGVVGLIQAFGSFDPERPSTFRSFAQFRIHGAILDSLRSLDWSSRELRGKARVLAEATRAATQRLGRVPDDAELAGAMGLSLAKYHTLRRDLALLEIRSLHLERRDGSDGTGEEELAFIPGAPENDPLFRCLQGEMKGRLADAIAKLPAQQHIVVTLYYHEELTMKEIGRTLGVVESRVSQIHAAAVLTLRASLAQKAAVCA